MVHHFLLMVHIKKIFYIWYRKYWHLVQGKTAKNFVFSSDFLTYGAPFYKWCCFTYGAVTYVLELLQKCVPCYKDLSLIKHINNYHLSNGSLSSCYLSIWLISLAKHIFVTLLVFNLNIWNTKCLSLVWKYEICLCMSYMPL
jgi:hypothetical protein